MQLTVYEDNTFLGKISLSDLQRAKDEIEKAAQTTSGESELPQALADLDVIDSMLAKQDWTSPNMVIQTTAYWKAATTLRDDRQLRSVWLNVACQRIMIAETAVMRFVLVTAHDNSFDLLQKHLSCSLARPCSCRDSLWLHALAVDIMSALELGKSKADFASSSYLPQLSHQSIYTYQPSRHSLHLRNSAAVKSATQILVNVLLAWFQLPTDNKTRARALFVHLICTHLGPDLLLLPQVWDAYGASMTWAVKHRMVLRQKQDFGVDDLSILQDQLFAHPLSRPDSEESQLLHVLGQCYLAFVQKALGSSRKRYVCTFVIVLSGVQKYSLYLQQTAWRP